METGLLSHLTMPLITFLVALVARSIFAFLETSITSMRLFKLKELSAQIGRYSNLFLALEKSPHLVIVSILIASSIADVTSAALATQIMESIFGHFNLPLGLGFSLGIGVASIALILFGEIIPKSLARERGEKLFQSMLWLTNLVYNLLSPIARILIRFSDTITHRFGEKTDGVSSEREIRFLVEYIHDKGLMEPEKSEMLRNVFDLGHTPIKDIMVPSTDIISVNINTPIDRVLDIFAEHHFTRMPVYEETAENIIGMIHQKDLFAMLSHNEKKPLKELVRPILFVPETVKVSQLLRSFREQQMHIAIVLNEHGSTTGLITLEDVLEEIVGEISDEHEPSAQKIVPLQQGGWLVEASIPLEDIGPFLGIVFETEDSVTLGGFLTEQLQHLPKKGDRILYKSYQFQIQKASPKRVHQVLVFKEKKD